ncbi:hypothetical protein KDM41_11935 [bacterium]|nr:hypothetical protein [bacterium]
MKRLLVLLIVVGSMTAPGPGIAQSLGFFYPISCIDDGDLIIPFTMYEEAVVRLVIGDSSTDLPVRTLVDGVLAAGQHEVVFDGRDESGEPLIPGSYTALLDGPDGLSSRQFVVRCGEGLFLGPGLVIDGRTVLRPIMMSIDGGAVADLGIYDATGTTRVSDLWQGTVGEATGLSWNGNGSNGPLPAGDYIMRMDSDVLDVDVPFSFDPYPPLELTLTMVGADGIPVVAGSSPNTSAQVTGPLQQMTATFDRPLTPAEIGILTDPNFALDGFLAGRARPINPTVWPDSTGITWPSFTNSCDWRDIAGSGRLETLNMCIGDEVAFVLGYDHEGITWRDGTCTPRGETDPTDWQTGPGPFRSTVAGFMDPPCGNPLLAGEVAEFRFYIPTHGAVKIRIVDSSGYFIRTLTYDNYDSGYHTLIWDRTRFDGMEVPPGLYHVMWDGLGVDQNRVVASGDILVSDLPAAAPDGELQVARPALLGNHPNPFNPATTIAFALPAPGDARVTVVGLDGRVVARLADGPFAAGRHEVVWNGRDAGGRPVASGAYLCRLEAGGTTSTRRLMLLK